MALQPVELKFEEEFLNVLQLAADRSGVEMGEFVRSAVAVAIDRTTVNYIQYLEQQLQQARKRLEDYEAAKETPTPPDIVLASGVFVDAEQQ